MDRRKLYNCPIDLTTQFKYCGNAFRIDTYKGCEFGCEYCFTKNNQYDNERKFKLANMNVINNVFRKAFETSEEYNDILTEMARHRVPLHLGGMSDPFQPREFKHKLTYKVIELSNKYNYPLIISTKQSNLPDEYFKILNPNIHAFQISLIGTDDKWIRKFELLTPTPTERINFIKKLKNLGFWVSIRIQPLIDVQQAKNVVMQCSEYVDYITVEHLKIYNRKDIKEKIIGIANIDLSDYKYTGKKYELNKAHKLKNINELKRISKCPIGCGDNDLHEYSDTNNCCGVDTMNNNFSNWLKYNSTYINKTGDNSQWYPTSDLPQKMDSYMKLLDDKKYKSLVDKYLINNTK